MAFRSLLTCTGFMPVKSPNSLLEIASRPSSMSCCVVLRYFVSLFVRPGCSVARTSTAPSSPLVSRWWAHCNKMGCSCNKGDLSRQLLSKQGWLQEALPAFALGPWGVYFSPVVRRREEHGPGCRLYCWCSGGTLDRAGAYGVLRGAAHRADGVPGDAQREHRRCLRRSLRHVRSHRRLLGVLRLLPVQPGAEEPRDRGRQRAGAAPPGGGLHRGGAAAGGGPVPVLHPDRG